MSQPSLTSHPAQGPVAAPFPAAASAGGVQRSDPGSADGAEAGRSDPSILLIIGLHAEVQAAPALLALQARLSGLGAQLFPLRDAGGSDLDAIQAVFDVTAPPTGPARWDERRVASLMRGVLSAVQRGSPVGAVVCLSPGSFGYSGPVGQAQELIGVLAAALKPGSVRLDDSTARVLRALVPDAHLAPLTVSIEPWDLLTDPDDEAPTVETSLQLWVATFQPPGAPRLRSDGAPPVLEGDDRFSQRDGPPGFGPHLLLFHGAAPGESDAWMRVDARRVVYRGEPARHRSFPTEPPDPHLKLVDTPSQGLVRPLYHGDSLFLRYRCPPNAYVYVIRQRDKELVAMDAGSPARIPGDPAEGTVEIVLDNRACLERPLILISGAPVHDLEALLTRLALEIPQDPSERLVRLVDLLGERGGAPPVALLEAGRFPHAERFEEIRLELLETAEREIKAGRFATAEEHLRALLAGDLPDGSAPRVRTILGRALRLQERRREAFAELELAVRDAQALSHHAAVALAERELGKLLNEEHKLDEARRHLHRAIAISQRLGDAIAEAHSQFQLAVSWWAEGALEQALSTWRQVEVRARQAGEGRLLSACLMEQGAVCHDLGRLDEAKDLLLQALDLFLRADDRVNRMRAYGDLGLLALESGDADGALDHLGAQLQLASRIAPPEAQARIRSHYAAALELCGRQEDAVLELTRAWEMLGDKRTPSALLVKAELGRLLVADGRLPEAGLLLADLDPEDRSLPFSLRWRIALARGRWCDAQRDAGAEAEYRRGLDAIEETRSLLSREMRVHFLTTQQALWEGWIGHILARDASPAALLDALEQSRARTFLDALSTSQPAEAAALANGDAHAPAPPTAAQSLAALPTDVAILYLHVLSDGVLALWIRAGDVTVRRLALPARGAQSLTQRLRDATSMGQVCDVRLRVALDGLSQAILAPMADLIRALPEDCPVGIVAHGDLHGVPFHALHLPDAPGQPLILSHPVFYAPSLRSIGHWLVLPPSPHHQVVALANPTGDLPDAEAEARRVLEILGQGWLGAGEDANVDELAERVQGARFLHIAAHARRGDARRRSVLRLNGGRRGRLQILGRAGLQADARGELGAATISQLTLDADLVVLSACEGGAGELNRAAEGPDLLSWAFLQAGARAVIASLWPVEDHTTAGLMERLYLHLSRGCPRALALARAQRETVAALASAAAVDPQGPRGGASPARWAGFFLTGDWRHP